MGTSSADAKETETRFSRALALIDAAHAEDPTSTTGPDGATWPYELHYARKMTRYLELHTGVVLERGASDGGGAAAADAASSSETRSREETPSEPPSEALQLAVRAQHLRRWEVPRSSYPATRTGYLSWRSGQGKRGAGIARSLCLEAGYEAETAERVAALVAKEGLRARDPEVQVLEDVACLVFLDDQFAGFVAGEGEVGVSDEDKVVRIVRKTWAKMGERGRVLAGGLPMEGRARDVLVRALSGE